VGTGTDRGLAALVAGVAVNRPLRVGLTGGVGSGKSTVSEMFAALGVPLIDADEISRDVAKPGGAAFDDVVRLFGTEAVSADGDLRRDHIRRLVFEDPGLRRRLESIIHPLVAEEIRRRAGRIRHSYCLISIPLLVETGMRETVDRVLVVDCPEELQVERTSRRDSIEAAQVLRMMQAQAGRADRLAAADDVISNDRDTDHLRKQVEALHERYLLLARESVATSS
jgi:dephospho-CoA kinase